MQIKRYSVTVMDNWTRSRTFWTLNGALAFWAKHHRCAYLWRWDNETNGWLRVNSATAPRS